MVIELVKACLLIFAAEMGDKSQILAMAFATQYKIYQVLIGISIGVIFNHGLAIMVGNFVTSIIPINAIQLFCGLMFIIFGILSVKDEDLEDEDKKLKFGPILAIAITFFLGELGDKTQLTAMSLATEGKYPMIILAGTTLGMLATSSLGIFVGRKLGDKIPEKLMKVVSSVVFILFGSQKLFYWLIENNASPSIVFMTIFPIYIIEAVLIYRFTFRKKPFSNMKVFALTLKEQTEILKGIVDDICLGETRCGNCLEGECIIGYTKLLINKARGSNEYFLDKDKDVSNLIRKRYNKNKIRQALSLIIKNNSNSRYLSDDKFLLNKIKNILEIILFDRAFKFDGNIDDYLLRINTIDPKTAFLLKKEIN